MLTQDPTPTPTPQGPKSQPGEEGVRGGCPGRECKVEVRGGRMGGGCHAVSLP